VGLQAVRPKEFRDGFVHLLDALGRINRVEGRSVGLEGFEDRNARFDVGFEPLSDDLDLVVGSSRFLGAFEQPADQDFFRALEIQNEFHGVQFHGGMPGL